MKQLIRAEHMYLFVITSIIEAGLILSGLSAAAPILRILALALAIVGNYALTYLTARGICADTDIDEVDYIYE